MYGQQEQGPTASATLTRLADGLGAPKRAPTHPPSDCRRSLGATRPRNVVPPFPACAGIQRSGGSYTIPLPQARLFYQTGPVSVKNGSFWDRLHALSPARYAWHPLSSRCGPALPGRTVAPPAAWQGEGCGENGSPPQHVPPAIPLPSGSGPAWTARCRGTPWHMARGRARGEWTISPARYAWHPLSSRCGPALPGRTVAPPAAWQGEGCGEGGYLPPPHFNQNAGITASP